MRDPGAPRFPTGLGDGDQPSLEEPFLPYGESRQVYRHIKIYRATLSERNVRHAIIDLYTEPWLGEPASFEWCGRLDFRAEPRDPEYVDTLAYSTDEGVEEVPAEHLISYWPLEMFAGALDMLIHDRPVVYCYKLDLIEQPNRPFEIYLGTGLEPVGEQEGP